MLLQLTVNNYAIARALDVELTGGMTAITGETGAGKSILLDALALALGDRADAEAITPGEERADICATLDVSGHEEARHWLARQELTGDDDRQCLLRRVVTREGRSRAWINGRQATLQQLRELGGMLIDIHSQHEHQSLLQRDTHRRLLDDFAGSAAQLQQVKTLYGRWQQVQARLQALRGQGEEQAARAQLLRYQVDELDRIAPLPGEVEQLDAEYRRLNSAGSQIDASDALLQICSEADGFNVRDGLQQASHLLRQSGLGEQLPAVAEMLATAAIQIDEAVHDLQRYRDRLAVDPERLQRVEQRQTLLFEVARKHRIKATELPALHQQLLAELAQLEGGSETVAALEAELAAQEQAYRVEAQKLGKLRAKAARTLAAQVQAQLASLRMQHCTFEIALTPLENLSANGLEQVEFLISTQPDQPPRALARIASGGELSRISLAIQVVTARTSRIPTIVFDEVDVGIGGATATVVGQLLRQLGESGQVLCVTHQAPVAARAHHHLQVSKTLTGKRVETRLLPLAGEQRIEEIARMIGGDSVSAQSRAHAQEMLEA